MANIDITLCNESFYYDTISCKLYWFEAPNKDVELCSNLKLDKVLNFVTIHIEELRTDLTQKISSLEDTVSYIMNDLDAESEMQHYVTKMQQEIQELQSRYDSMIEVI